MHPSTISYALVALFAVAFLSPNAAISQPPAQPGQSGVVRFSDFFGFFVYDLDRGLLSIHSTSTPFAEICEGTPPVVDFLDIQTIATASGLHAIFKGQDHNVEIYPAVPFDCSFLASAPLIAVGTAQIVRTDNDVLGSGSPGIDAFGWQAHGILFDAETAGLVRYTEIVRVLATPTAVVERVTNINLH